MSKYPGLEHAIETVKALRAPNGCPWDRSQTHESLRPYLLEETYEVLEALDQLQTPKASSNLKEELGDLLLQVLLHAQIASERGEFTMDDLAGSLAEKLVRRHPHVFGGNALGSAEEVASQWENTKQAEKPRKSALEGIPPALPALQQSLKVIEKVSKVGFQWESLEGPLNKVSEELEEFRAEVEKLGPPEKVSRVSTQSIDPTLKKRLESELGDLIFTLSNVAFFLHLNPEDALRAMLSRFTKRFHFVEERARQSGRKLEEMTQTEMDEFWNEAKKI